MPGHCYNLVNAWYSNAVFSIITDILILILPMHMVYKLQRDKREKLMLYAVFGLGALYGTPSWCCGSRLMMMQCHLYKYHAIFCFEIGQKPRYYP